MFKHNNNATITAIKITNDIITSLLLKVLQNNNE